MNLLVNGVPVALALVAAALVTGLLVRFPGMLDQPGHRSLHQVPVPRTGGIGIICGFACGLLVQWSGPADALAGQIIMGLGFGGLAVAAISFMDDRGHVPAAARLGVHFVAVAILLVPLGIALSPTGVLIALSLVWGINLFNFMDGIDGLAGAMAASGALTLGALGFLAGDAGYAWTAFIVAAAALGFLAWNRPPARIFMGDTGSATLGFLLGGLAWWGWREALFPWQCAVLPFLPFLVDASLTLLLRALRGERVWQAHREHIYQQLVLAGWSVRKVLFFESVIMLACGLAAIAAGAEESIAGRMLATAVLITISGYFLLRRWTASAIR